jgi:hypothetical protein
MRAYLHVGPARDVGRPRCHDLIVILLLFIAVIIIVVIVIVGWALRDRIGKAMAEEPVERRVQRAPLLLLRQLRPQTDVRVVGQISGDAEVPTQAPLSGRACMAWYVVLERRMNASDTDSQEYWEAELTEESGNVVELHDETGRTTVLLAGARWELANEHIVRLVYEMDLTEPTRAFLARNQINWGGYFKPTYRFREYVLERGARVCVFGQARRQGALVEGGGVYRDAPSTLVFAAGKDWPLIVSDPPAAQTGGSDIERKKLLVRGHRRRR